nr:MAG TPA: hypothetical protein [Caudoviricetes sp.]
MRTPRPLALLAPPCYTILKGRAYRSSVLPRLLPGSGWLRPRPCSYTPEPLIHAASGVFRALTRRRPPCPRLGPWA